MLRYDIILILVSGMLFAMGLIFGIAGVVLKVTGKKKRERCTRTTQGIVKEIQRERLSGAEIGEAPLYSWYPVFRFDAGGQPMELRLPQGVQENTFYVAQKVTICYNPDSPNEFYVKEQKGLGVAGAFLITAAGLLFAAVCAGFVLFLIKGGYLWTE